MEKIQSVRGMNDTLPDVIPVWHRIEKTASDVFAAYGYKEIRFPIIEQTALFKRAIGEVTDIVEKEMYTFEDRNGDSLSLRPEGTACCVRACEQHGLLHNQSQRLWYSGPMFRHERPQKGRLRQFHQIGVEAFGYPGVDIEFEMLLMISRLWKKLGLADVVELQINSLGSAISRNEYKNALVGYLEKYYSELDEDSQKRLYKNPLRILDSKNEQTRKILQDAPCLEAYFESESKKRFELLKSALDSSGISYRFNPTLVRGLDYYNDTVFEWVTSHLGAQGTVCAGGRYDSLVSQLGGKPIEAFGFALGVERLVLLIDAMQPLSGIADADVFVIADAAYVMQAMLLAEACRTELDGKKVVVNVGGGSLKSQFKRADKSGALVGLVIGETEIANTSVTVKMLREDLPQIMIKNDRVASFLKNKFTFE